MSKDPNPSSASSSTSTNLSNPTKHPENVVVPLLDLDDVKVHSPFNQENTGQGSKWKDKVQKPQEKNQHWR